MPFAARGLGTQRRMGQESAAELGKAKIGQLAGDTLLDVMNVSVLTPNPIQNVATPQCRGPRNIRQRLRQCLTRRPQPGPPVFGQQCSFALPERVHVPVARARRGQGTLHANELGVGHARRVAFLLQIVRVQQPRPVVVRVGADHAEESQIVEHHYPRYANDGFCRLPIFANYHLEGRRIIPYKGGESLPAGDDRRPPSRTMSEATDTQMLEKLRDAHQRLRKEIGKIIVGQEEVLDQLLMAIFCRGHALLVGVPGLAKTLMVSTLAQALDLTFKRIQFTPDLMPTDITGTEVIQDDPVTRQRMFKFLPGPIFANIVLADEINRTPPKTQAALLEAMQERKASIGGIDHPMKDPFFVLATQNPIEQEGTYPLPEAQLDRFLFLIKVDYPTDDEEEQIMRHGHVGRASRASRKVLHGDDILELQHIVRRVPVADHVFHFAKRITRHDAAGHAGGGRLRQQVADLGRRARGRA